MHIIIFFCCCAVLGQRGDNCMGLTRLPVIMIGFALHAIKLSYLRIAFNHGWVNNYLFQLCILCPWRCSVIRSGK